MMRRIETSATGPDPRRAALGLVVVAWGVQAIVTQSLLLREALVLMFGSELAWGIVWFAWLFGVAVGAAIGGRTAARLRHADVALVVVLLTLSATACVELWVFRGARAWLGVGPGELLPLAKTAVAAMLFVSPAGSLVGMAFPLACRLAADLRDRALRGAGPLGGIYALESLGSLVGGAAFSFWAVEHLAPIETALLCAAVMAAAAAALLATTRRRRRGPIAMAVLAFVALGACAFAGSDLDNRLILRRWQNIAPGYQLCAEAETKYQNLVVGRRLDQYSLYCDGHVSTDFPDPYTFVPHAHAWMCQHPEPRCVLLLGGGAEGLLAEVLRHPVTHVDYVEIDPRQIELIEPFIQDADRAALADTRVTVHHSDARYFIKTQRNRFDLVIARLPEPTSALRARFYTDEFFRELRRAMTGRAVLCTTVAAAPADLPVATATYVASFRATLRRHFPHVVIGWGDTAQVLAATDVGLVSVDPVELADRYARRGIQSPFFHPLMFESTDELDPDKLRARSEQLDAATNITISTDLRPAIYMQRLVLWEQMTGDSAGRLIEYLRAVKWSWLAAALFAVGAVVAVANRLTAYLRPPTLPAGTSPWAPGAVILSVATTGFATMALSIVWLFAFQNLYGYVYQRIGWIIAMFMGGLVIGCWLASRMSDRAARLRSPRQANKSTHPATAAGLTTYLWRRLIAVDVLVALLALAAPFALSALAQWQDTRGTFVLVECVVSIMVALTGVLGGAAFAFAGGLRLGQTGRADSAAGSIDAADHAGACLGALLTGILLVPVFGTAVAAFLLVGIKLCSAAFLLLARGKPQVAP